MRKYWYEPNFQRRMRLEDSKGAAWESDKLDEPPCWEADELSTLGAEA